MILSAGLTPAWQQILVFDRQAMQRAADVGGRIGGLEDFVDNLAERASAAPAPRLLVGVGGCGGHDQIGALTEVV